MTGGTPPLIGITADVADAASRYAHGKDTTLFLPQRYFAAIEGAGAIPIILSAVRSKFAVRRLLGMLDGLVLSGGDFDIHPSFYGEHPIAALGKIKSERTEFELEITDQALKRDLPILGICGGAQVINVVSGGSLYQDIPTQLSDPGACEHSSKNSQGAHPIRVEPGTCLFKIVKRSRLKVNTSHHQAMKRIGRGLIVNAIADDGVIEGIESTSHEFVLGVQWHPEVLATRQSHQRSIFTSFVDRCKKSRLTR